MKNINKYLSLGVISLMGAGWLVSCDNSKDNDSFTEYTGAPGVYFSNDANSYLELDKESSTISYPVYRDEAGAELTVDIAVAPIDSADEGLVDFPSSVTFPAGSRVADLTIGYDINKLEMGVEHQYQVVLDAESTPFSSNVVVLTIVNPAPWTYLGIGEYYDYGWGISDSSAGPVAVTFWQQGLDKNVYRVSNPYIAFNEMENSYFEFRVCQEGQVIYNTQITEPDLVAFGLYYITYDPDNGDDVYLAHPGQFNGTSISQWRNSRVVQYQDNGMPGYIQLAPYYYLPNVGGALNYPNPSPYIYMNFPDFELLDTSLELAYEGVLTPESQIQQVLVSVEMGDDITEVRAAVAPGKNVDAIAKDIADGKIEYATINESGPSKIPFGNDNETGDYSVVALGYVKGELKSQASVSFFYRSSTSDYDPNKGWKSLGYVDYTDGYVCANVFLNNPIVSYSLEWQESEETPGLYRLVNPYGEPYPFNEEGEYNAYLDSYLYVDATNRNHISILESPQTLDWGSYGKLDYCWSMAQYFLENGSGGQPVTEEILEEAGYYAHWEDDLIYFNGAMLVDTPQGKGLSSTLCAYWSYFDDPDYDGLVSANVVLDYDQYVASNYTDPYMYNSDGNLYNPFLIDLSKLNSPNTVRHNGHVVLTKHPLMPYKSSLNRLYKPEIKDAEKKTQQLRNFGNPERVLIGW